MQNSLKWLDLNKKAVLAAMNSVCRCAGSVCVVLSVGLAQASDEATLQRIVVTGERLPRLLSETASSVAVITGEMNESLAGADRVEELLSLVPNVQLGSGGTGPTIRGQDSTGVLRDLPSFLGGTRPRTTLQVDGRAVSFNEFVFGLTSVWDVSQVEVFRSPQTTTQGRNSIGGAIFIETRDPEYAWDRRVRVLGGNYDTRQASAVVSGPLVADQLAFRIAGDLRRSRPSSEINDLYAGTSPDNDDYDVIRVKLHAEPKALPGMRLLATYAHVESTMPQIEGVRAPFEARKDPAPGYGVFSTDVDSLTGVLDYGASAEIKDDAVVGRRRHCQVCQARPGADTVAFQGLLGRVSPELEAGATDSVARRRPLPGLTSGSVHRPVRGAGRGQLH